MIEEVEAQAFVYEFLTRINPEIAEKYRVSAFKDEEATKTLEARLGQLPPDFLSGLVDSKMPQTDFPSLIRKSDRFQFNGQNTNSELVTRHVQMLHLTNRIVGHRGVVRILYLDPARLFMVSVSDDSTMKLWHLPSLSLMFTFKGHENLIWSVDVTPDRQLLGSVSDDRTLRLWSLVDGKCVCLLKRNGFPPFTCIAFSSCGTYMLASSERSGKVVIWEIKNRNMMYQSPVHLKTVPLKSPIKHCCFSPGGTFIAAALESGFVAVFTVHGNHLWTANIGEKCEYVHFNPNMPSQLIAISTKGALAVILNISSKLAIAREFDPKRVIKRTCQAVFALSCDNSLLFGCTSTQLLVWDIGDGSLLQRIDGLSQASVIVAHPLVNTLVAHVGKSCVSVYSSQSAEPVVVFRIPPNAPGIVTGCWDKNGLSFYAGDRLGGIYVFRQSSSTPEPRCVTTEHFFPNDFTPSKWVDDVQVEESTGNPVHFNPRSPLITSNFRILVQKYRPHNFEDIACQMVWNKSVKYIRAVEKKLLSNYGSFTETVEQDKEDQSEESEDANTILSDEVEVAFSYESTSSGPENNEEEVVPKASYSPWTSVDSPTQGTFFPQVGDRVVYVKEGHIEMLESRNDLRDGIIPSLDDESAWPNQGQFLIERVEFARDYCTVGFSGQRTFKYDIDNAPAFLIPKEMYDDAAAAFAEMTAGDGVVVYFQKDGVPTPFSGRVLSKLEKETLYNALEVGWGQHDVSDFLSPWEVYSVNEEMVYDWSPESHEFAQVLDAVERVVNSALKSRALRPLFKQPPFHEAVVYPCDLGLIRRRLLNNFYRHKEALLRDLNAVVDTHALLGTENQAMANLVVGKLRRVVNDPSVYESVMDFSEIEKELKDIQEAANQIEQKEITRVKKRNPLKATQSVYEYELEQELDDSSGSEGGKYQEPEEDDEDEFCPTAPTKRRKRRGEHEAFKRNADDSEFSETEPSNDEDDYVVVTREASESDGLDEFTVEDKPRSRKKKRQSESSEFEDVNTESDSE